MNMRPTLALVALACTLRTEAQTIVSVTDGEWNDPATWDCACLPGTQDVEVLHDVEITTNIIFFNSQIHVATGGLLFMMAPYSVAITETLYCEGTLHLIGDVDVDGLLVIQADAQVIGEVHNDNALSVIGPGADLHVEGDLINDGVIDGNGYICVTDLTVNSGTLEGQIDFCDGSPTTAVPPIIDINTGTVGPEVTFCATAVCVAGVLDHGMEEPITLWPVPVHDQLTIVGLPAAVDRLLLMDGSGRVLRSMPRSEVIRMTGITAGSYMLVPSSGQGRRMLRLIVE